METENIIVYGILVDRIGPTSPLKVILPHLVSGVISLKCSSTYQNILDFMHTVWAVAMVLPLAKP